MKPGLIVAIGGVITLIGAAISLLGNYLSGVQQRESAQKLADAQNEGFRQITGGDSFCYLKLFPSAGAKVEVAVLHTGKYPLSDVRLRFVDSDKLSGPKPPGLSTLEFMKSAETNFPIGTLPVSGFFPLTVIEIPDGVMQKHYLASFTARNGSWDETIVLRRAPKGEWRVALKVNENPGQVKFEDLNKPWKLRFHAVDPDFPAISDRELRDFIGEDNR